MHYIKIHRYTPVTGPRAWVRVKANRGPGGIDGETVGAFAGKAWTHIREIRVVSNVGHDGGRLHARYTQPSLETLRATILRAIPPIG